MAESRRRSDAVTIHIALLKGVNIAGNKQVAMSGLRDLCTRLGFGDVRTVLQSGNLLFASPARNGADLERLLETETEKRLGVRTDYFVRTAREWSVIVARNPYPEQATRDPARLALMCLKHPVKPASVLALRAAIAGPETVHAAGREAYVVYPNGFGRSKVTNALIGKMLGSSCTGRNWNTVLKLAALAGA